MLSGDQLVAFAQQQSPAVVAVSVVLAALVLQRVFSPRKQPALAYPKPASTLPIVGNTLDMMFFHNHRVYDWITDQSLALNRPWLMGIVGSVPIISISTPELFEDVFKTQFDVFIKGREEADFFVELFGKGILASDGDVWYFHRKTASNLFSNQMMRDVMYEAVLEKATTLCESLRTYESRGDPTSFKSVISLFTADVFGKIGFGVDLDCLQNGLAGKPGNEFIDAFADTTRIMFDRYQTPTWLWHFKRSLSIGSEKVLKHSVGVIDKFIFRIINESIAKKNAGDEPTVPTKDLISLFLNSKVNGSEDIKGKAFDSELHLIRDTVVNFIFAGKDTTSHSMCWFIVMMNRHPEVLKKIRAELREKLPGLASGEMVAPPMDDLPQLIYLEAAIRENLRVNPVVPASPRQACRDTVLSDGTPIRKGTRVALALYTASRKTSVWGEDALEFKPERWIDPDTGKLLVVSPFKFAYFWGGPRQCIGMKFAMMELKCTLAVLVSKFDLKTVENPWELTYQPALTMGVKGQMMVEITSSAAKVSVSDEARVASN
ncbi:Cytochrome p450 [Globisporangium polare]